MTREDLKAAVTKKYKEGQQVPIRIGIEGKRVTISTTAEIVKFNPDTVLTKHNGYLESFRYYDFIIMTTPRKLKPGTMKLPDQFRRYRK